MKMKTISFQISKKKEIEPESFIYGIIIESENINEVIQLIGKIKSNNIVKQNIPTNNYTIPENEDELKAIQIFSIIGRKALVNFIKKLSPIQGIRGGIIKTEIKNKEVLELDLIFELTQAAKLKAAKYAQICGRALLGIISFKVLENNLGGWTAYPPANGINKESIYHSIMMNYERKDKFEINRTVEIEFEMK